MEYNEYCTHNNNVIVNKFRPKAIVARTISSKLKNETCVILSNYGPMSICTFPTLYKFIFDEIFPINSLGFDDGLYGYFRELGDLIDLEKNGSDIMVVLKNLNYSNLLDSNQRLLFNCDDNNEARIKRHAEAEDNFKILYDKDNKALWKNWEHLLDLYPINLIKSPYQLRLENYSDNHQLFTNSILELRKSLCGNPDGVRLNKLKNYANINKKLYENCSIESIVKSWPEVFFIEDYDDPNPLVYDGYNKTYNIEELLTSARNAIQTNQSPELIAIKAIENGLYQKTLLLLHEAKSEGLKLAVWKESVRINFQDNDKLFESMDISMINELRPIKIFVALHAVGLIRLESDKYSKNDIRIYLPSEDFEYAFDRLVSNLCNFKRQKEDRAKSILKQRDLNLDN